LVFGSILSNRAHSEQNDENKGHKTENPGCCGGVGAEHPSILACFSLGNIGGQRLLVPRSWAAQW
jgi:hypothetical protein